MNLTAEQICDLKQEICEDNGWMRDAIPRFHAVFDMAKRTLAAEKDAERYRLLRKQGSGTMMHNKHRAGEIQVIQWEDKTTANVLKGDALDATIDALRSRS